MHAVPRIKAGSIAEAAVDVTLSLSIRLAPTRFAKVVAVAGVAEGAAMVE